MPIDAAPTALVVLTTEGVVDANAAAAALFDADPDDLLGDGIVDRVAPAQRDGLRDAFAAASAGDMADRGEVVVTTQTDPPRHLEVTFGPVTDGRIVAAISDETDVLHVMMLLAYSANTTMVIDAEAQILWGPVGRYAAQELGSPWYGRGEANPFGWLHPEDISRVLDAFKYVLSAPGVVHELTVRTRHVILEDQWGTATIRAINLLSDPLIAGILIQTQAEGQDEKVSLGRTTGSFQSIAEAAPIGIVLSDHLGRTLYWNDVARRLFDLGPTDRSEGATPADVDWPSMAAPEHVAPLRVLLSEALEGGQGEVTARFHLPGGDTRWLSVVVAPQLNDVGEPMGWLATLQDLTREKAIQAQLEATQERLIHLAGHDPLTGLANRRLFAEQLTRAVARMGRDQQGVALLFCDLDSFKPINDTHGHDTGDLVLIEMARRLLAGIRTNDLAARLGGDEFVVLVEGFAGIDEVEVIAQRLVAAASEPIEVGGSVVRLGASIGIAVARGFDSADSLLSRADDLMYRAKALGKGRFVLDEAT